MTDILYDMRNHIRHGEPPTNCVHAALYSSSLMGSLQELRLTPEELRYLEEKLYDGFFAFEAMVARDWDSAVCGICGIALVFESGDGNVKNCTPLKKGQVMLY